MSFFCLYHIIRLAEPTALALSERNLTRAERALPVPGQDYVRVLYWSWCIFGSLMLGQDLSHSALDLPNHISLGPHAGSPPHCTPEGLHVKDSLVFPHAITLSSSWE